METLSIGAFVVGICQILKNLELFPKKYTQLVAVAIGAAATYVSLYQPELWKGLSEFLIGLTATGLVSFAIEIKER